jgi:hypothetical protein
VIEIPPLTCIDTALIDALSCDNGFGGGLGFAARWRMAFAIAHGGHGRSGTLLHTVGFWVGNPGVRVLPSRTLQHERQSP